MIAKQPSRRPQQSRKANRKRIARWLGSGRIGTMLRKVIFSFLAIIFLLAAYFLFDSVFGGGEEVPQGNNSNVQAEKKKEEVWDGRSEHFYNMQIPDSQGGSLVLERVSFSGLRSPRSTAIVRFTYLGSSLPSWLRPGQIKKSFSAFYQGSDDQVVLSLAAGPLEDDTAVIDLSLRQVPSARLSRNSQKGLFVRVRGLLSKPLSVRIVATPEPGYKLGSR